MKESKIELSTLVMALPLTNKNHLTAARFQVLFFMHLHSLGLHFTIPFKIITAHPLTLSPPPMNLSSLNIKLSTLPSHPLTVKQRPSHLLAEVNIQHREFLHFIPQSLLYSSKLFFPYQTKKGVKSRVIEDVNDVLWIMR